MFGANDVAAVAFATEAGHKSASGLVLAVWGVGSFAAALLYGSRTWGWPLWKQLMAGLVGSRWVPRPSVSHRAWWCCPSWRS